MEIITLLEGLGFLVEQKKRITFTATQAKAFFATAKETADSIKTIKYITTGECVILGLVAPNAVDWLKEVGGPVNPSEAKKTHPHSIRALFGKDIVKNAFHCSSSKEDAIREAGILFPEGANEQ